MIATVKDYRGRGGTAELFDVSSDPHEREDLAAREPERLASMLAYLRETRRALAERRIEPGHTTETSDELRQRLEALGYAEPREAPEAPASPPGPTP